MARLPARTLRQHLMLLVLFSVIPAMALAVYAALRQYGHSREHLVEGTNRLAHHIANEQRELLERTRQRLEAFARMPEVRQRDAAACGRRFAEQLPLHPEYSNLGLAGRDGKVRCSAVPFVPSLDISHGRHFQETVRTRQASFSHFAAERLEGESLMVISGPVLDDTGALSGVLFASVPPAWYAKVAQDVGLPQGVRLTVLDGDLNVLARNPPDRWIGRNVSARPLGALLRAADKQGTAYAEGLDGGDRFFAFHVVGESQQKRIFIVVSTSTRALYAGARADLAQELLGLLVLMVLVLLGAGLGVDRLVLRPVREMMAAARSFTAGNRAVRLPDSGGSREIVIMKRVFNKTVATLGDQLTHIERLNRLYNVSSAINKAIVRIRDRQTLFDEVCRIAVEIGRFQAAWIGVPDAANKAVKPAAFAGFSELVVGQLNVSLDADDPRGQGMMSRALRDNEPVVINDRLNDPTAAPWRELLSAQGLRSGAAFPIRVEGKAEAALSLYAGEAGYFEEKEIRLLQELAGDAGLALEIMRKEQQLHALSNYDRLTGLPNRRLYEDRLAQAIKGRRYHDRNVGLVIVRVNRFRQINDVAGWLAGDTVLKAVATYLEGTVREGDTVARHGDNEFAIILADVTNPEDVMAVCDKILEGFPRVVATGNGDIIVTVNAGIAIYPTDALEALDLMQKAQFALDSIRTDGKTAFAFYSRATDQKAHERHRIEANLLHALERGELSLHFQPIVAISSRQAQAAEALLRWKNPELGDVSPSVFVPIAEENGLIVPIGYWVLEQACNQLRAWHEQGMSKVKVQVNVSVLQLREPDFLARVAQILERTRFNPEAFSLGMEITESEVMQNLDHAVSVLEGLRCMGISLSIDDFGTGYSSLSYLRELPIHTLKIDVSFIHKVAANSDAAAITRSIVALAHGLNLEVVAEGVETEEQFSLLEEFGCDKAQGLLFSGALCALGFARYVQTEELAALS